MGVTEIEVITRRISADGGAVGWRRYIERFRKAAETGGVGGARIVVIIATESKPVAIPDQVRALTAS